MIGYTTRSLSEIWASLQQYVPSIKDLGVPDEGEQRREALRQLYMARHNTDNVPHSMLNPANKEKDFHLALQAYQMYFYSLRRGQADTFDHRK